MPTPVLFGLQSPPSVPWVEVRHVFANVTSDDGWETRMTEPNAEYVPHTCPPCGGRGKSRTEYGWLSSPCERCGGSGVVVIVRDGSGFVTHPAPLAPIDGSGA